jgi:hypothetical protein
VQNTYWEDMKILVNRSEVSEQHACTPYEYMECAKENAREYHGKTICRQRTGGGVVEQLLRF